VSGPDRSAEDAKEALSFEQIVDQLSAVVSQLEDGALPLEHALQAFERGVALSRLGSKRLDEAERRIEVLLHDTQGQGVETRPYEGESDDE